MILLNISDEYSTSAKPLLTCDFYSNWEKKSDMITIYVPMCKPWDVLSILCWGMRKRWILDENNENLNLGH